jgi:cold shock CspA family protein
MHTDMQMVDAADRISGTVFMTFPNRGYFWLIGEDDVKYFAHQAKVRDGTSLFDLREGQKCTFVPARNDRGPTAVAIDVVKIPD